MKSLLQPNLWKIALTVILFYASSALWRAFVISHISDTFPRGFPFEYYVGWGPCPPGETCFEYNTLFLVLDVVIWYVVSAFIIDIVPKKRT